MNYIPLIIIFFCIIGTLIGAVIGCIVGTRKKRILNYLIGFSSGIMIGVCVFDIIQEAMDLTGPLLVVIMLLFCICFVAYINKVATSFLDTKKFPTMALTLLIAMILHNIPEGLAMGSVSIVDFKHGFLVCLVIAIHDIPEGLVLAAVLKKSGVGNTKTILIVLFSAVFKIIGAIFGFCFTINNDLFISFIFCFASGAMLYVSFYDLIPDAYLETKSVKIALSIIIGLLASILLIYLR